MARRLKSEVCGVDRRLEPADVLAKGWEAIFAGDVPLPLRLVVEIGFGRGEFLKDLAAQEPETAFLGIELSHKRTVKMAHALARLECANVRLLEGRAERLVEELLAPGSVQAFWVNFSDPWPKKRHHKRRLLQPDVVHDLAVRLAPMGQLQVATDDPSYAEWIHDVLSVEPLLENALAPADCLREVPGRLRTSYEVEWRGKGRIPYFWTYRKRSADSRT